MLKRLSASLLLSTTVIGYGAQAPAMAELPNNQHRSFTEPNGVVLLSTTPKFLRLYTEAKAMVDTWFHHPQADNSYRVFCDGNVCTYNATQPPASPSTCEFSVTVQYQPWKTTIKEGCTEISWEAFQNIFETSANID